MTDFPKVSVVIVNLNKRLDLRECVQSVLENEYPMTKLEIIVVDNGSIDGSAEYILELSKVFQNVKVIKLSKNYGFCLANNIGARMARGDWLFFLNNDTTIDKHCISELAKNALKYEKRGIVALAPKILYSDATNVVQVAGGTLSIIGFGYYIGDGQLDGPSFNILRYVGFASGAAAFVKRDFFIKVKGFDPFYFASAEEAELGFKAWLSGKRVLYIPTAIVYHKVSKTFGARGPQIPLKVFLQTRNRLFNVFKVFEPHNVVYGFLVSLLLDSTRVLRYMLLFRKGHCALATLQAYLAFLRSLNVKHIKDQRRFMQSIRLIRDDKLKKTHGFSSLNDCLRREVALIRLWSTDLFKKDWNRI